LVIGLYELLDPTTQLIESPGPPLTLVFLITTLIHYGLSSSSIWPGRSRLMYVSTGKI
jgi:hypothetical protein